jgi:hypothetical protein
VDPDGEAMTFSVTLFNELNPLLGDVSAHGCSQITTMTVFFTLQATNHGVRTKKTLNITNSEVKTNLQNEFRNTNARFISPTSIQLQRGLGWLALLLSDESGGRSRQEL